MSTQIDSVAGAYAPTANVDRTKLGTASTLVSLLAEMKKNFLEKNVEIMQGLTFNQYKTIEKIHFYINSKFVDGDYDELGNQKYFHNIINHRNSQATKNLDLDTKDMLVTTDMESGYWFSWILRMELRDWMDESGFALKLNRLAERLPQFGSFVWKKTLVTDKDGDSYVCVEEVDLRDLINDQSAATLKDSEVMAHRILMTPQEMRDKVADGWDSAAVEQSILAAGTTGKKNHYLTQRENANAASYSITDSIPVIDAYEMWGWVPESVLPTQEPFNLRPENPDPTKYKYVMAIVSGVNTGEKGAVLYAKEVDPEEFPYREMHMRKQHGRWLGLGNTELLFALQVRINELVNRFFAALRLGSIHIFQTRGKLYLKNLLQDALDGDIIESSHPIEPLATELRAFNQYETEMKNIEALADQICNTFEIVTGESMPAATPFRLGAQLGVNANKFFEFVRENCGIFVGEVMVDWILPSLATRMSSEHMLSLAGSGEELNQFLEAYTQSHLLDELKKYILETGFLPSQEDLDMAKKAIMESLKNGEKKIKVEKDFIKEEDLDRLRIKFSATDENNNKASEQATLGTVLQIVTSNPAVMDDPRVRMIIGRLLEQSGISPIKIAGFLGSSTPPPVPMMPDGTPANAASPAMSKFAANPGDASSKMPSSVAAPAAA